jgi:hypothetical protein
VPGPEKHGQDSCERSLQRLDEIGRLPNGWDGGVAIRPSARSLEQAAAFVRALGPSAPSAAIAASADGSIEFDWEPQPPRLAVGVAFTLEGSILLAAFDAERVVAEEESDDPGDAAQFVGSFLGGDAVRAR